MVKRLLCIVGSMNAGGAETFLMKVFRALDKSKYQMDFAVAVEDEGFYDKEIIELGGNIYHITPKSKGVLKNFNDIRSLVKREKYIYVLRTSQHSLSALELLAAKMGGAKVRVFRSSNSNTTTGSSKQLFIHKVCMFMPLLFSNVRVAPSTEAAEYMFGRNCVKNGRAHLINNAIDTDYYTFSDISRKQIRQEFSIGDDNLVIGHIGRFNQQKNHMFLLEVFRALHERNPESVLLLVGGGELQSNVEKKAKEMGIFGNVIFANIRQDIPNVLSAMDVFVFPSLYEGMPNTVIEAQATGLRCVISDTITKEADVTGLVDYLPINSPVIWAEKILNNCNYDRKSMAEELSKKGYTIDSSVSKFVDCIFER